MAGETEKYLARIAQDRIPSSEEWQRRAMKILETGRAYDEQETVPSIWPGNTFNTVPLKPKPDNWLYNTLSNPKLNRGLETLAGNAADVILGRESGNALVDLGASNIPGIGAASILAAGGIPGLVDAVGAGELRNLKKIPKYTYEFVKEFFGDRGLKNLDNALTKYPKAEKPSVNDALYILKTGLGGEQVPAINPYRSNDIFADIGKMNPMFNIPRMIELNKDKIPEDVLSDFRRMAEHASSENDALAALDAASLFHAYTMGRKNIWDKIVRTPKSDRWMMQLSAAKETDLEQGSNFYDTVRRFKELSTSPTQDWESIVTKQERKDARKQQKQPKDAVNQETHIDAPTVQETPVQRAWDPSVRDDSFYRQFGKNLTPESKRDAFVVDSLANHWARQLVGHGKAGKLTDADIVDALDRAEARHTRSNYNAVSQGFYDDVKKNIETGNMPGKSVSFGPKYRKNVITNRDTPTLLLAPEELPTYYDSQRIWADEQEGPDLYELVFRPKADEILNSINPAYWLYRK